MQYLLTRGILNTIKSSRVDIQGCRTTTCNTDTLCAHNKCEYATSLAGGGAPQDTQQVDKAYRPHKHVCIAAHVRGQITILVAQPPFTHPHTERHKASLTVAAAPHLNTSLSFSLSHTHTHTSSRSRHASRAARPQHQGQSVGREVAQRRLPGGVGVCLKLVAVPGRIGEDTQPNRVCVSRVRPHTLSRCGSCPQT